jgi:hypothetical protein
LHRATATKCIVVSAIACLAIAGALSLRVTQRKLAERPAPTPTARVDDVDLARLEHTPVAVDNLRLAAKAPPPVPQRPAPTEVDALATALRSDCATGCRSRRLDTIEAAVATRSFGAIPWLSAVDISGDGYVAAAAIRALGNLATDAPKAERALAVGALAGWLTKVRALGEEGLGNVSLIVDALGDTGALEAVDPLVSALDSGTLPIYIETRIVESLAAIGAPSALGAIQRFAARLEALGEASTPFDAELRAEARAAALAYLARQALSPR